MYEFRNVSLAQDISVSSFNELHKNMARFVNCAYRKAVLVNEAVTYWANWLSIIQLSYSCANNL